MDFGEYSLAEAIESEQAKLAEESPVGFGDVGALMDYL